MSSLNNSPDYRHANELGSDNEDAVRHVYQKVEHRVLQFLLARFFLLNLLIAEAFRCEGGFRPSDHRLLWVLLQARPTDMLKADAFAELAECLQIASVEDLKTLIKEEYLKLKLKVLESVNHPATGHPMCQQPLYCFLDGIQTITAMEEYSDRMPLLQPIWQLMTEILQPMEMRLILSGTTIDENLLMNSSVFKFHPYIIKRDIGGFDDQDAQSRYIEYYLQVDQSASRQDFLKRAWEWCHGRYSQESFCLIDTYHFVLRHQITAVLIELILANGPNSPHKILNSFVQSSTKFLPTDGEKWCNDEPNIDDFHLKMWKFDRMGV